MIASRHIHLGALALGMGGALGIAACSSSSSSGSSTGGNDSGVTGNDASGSSSGGSSDSGSDAAPGPGATVLCASSGKNAWETYGANAFVAVNQSIFANVTAQLADAGTTNLGPSLKDVGTANVPATTDQLPTFEGKLAAFLVYAYGGPTSIVYTDGTTYVGPQDMTAAHTGLNITSDQYNYFVTNIIVPALTSNGVPMGDVSSCFAPVVTDAAFVASIVGH